MISIRIASSTFLSFFALAILLILPIPGFTREGDSNLRGWVFDDDTGEAVACRLYIESEAGKFFLAEPADMLGQVVTYEKKRGDRSVEIHSCLSAHPFQAKLPPGKYTVYAERGHEYLPASAEVTIGEGEHAEVEIRLKRWINMAQRGWFSGDTHCHRTLKEMPVLLNSEDLNVGFPLTGWVTDTANSPADPDHNKVKFEKEDVKPFPMAVKVGPNHVYWPVNTEYEIFSVEGKKHTLGAFFVLNHKDPIEETVPPVTPVFDAAISSGALIDFDKHNWPWTLMLPTALEKNGLFELANNHLWRTEFGVTDWYPEMMANYMAIPPGPNGEPYGEEGWLDFGFKTYYALLNSGFKLRPTAGTGSGVHPVPYGFGRVYVKPLSDKESDEEPEKFTYENWINGLKQGRSFVTTGPMLSLTFSENHPGAELDEEASKKLDRKLEIVGRVESAFELDRLEIVVNGEPVEVEIGGTIGSRAPHSAFIREEIELETTSWVAFRAFAKTETGRIRFAHTAPVWVEMEDKPLLPTILEADYLRGRMEAEVARNKGVISDEALAEFEAAEEFYDELLKKAAKAAE